MPDAPLSLFISYSRTDSAFVDRLEADLKARSFHTWVDRHKIEGGQDWLNKIEKALDASHICLIVVSPQAVASEWVRMEYRYARQQGKPLIPLHHLSTPKVPIDLNGLQWIDFQNNYSQGLHNLLIVLNHLALARDLATNPSTASGSILASKPESAWVPPQPAQPMLDADLNDLY